MRPIERPRAVIFDWDNTLVDTFPVITTCMNAALRAFGKPEWTEAQTRERAHKSLRDTFPGLFGADRWEEARRVFYATFESIHLQQLKPKPDAADLLHELVGRSLYLAVVSNKTGHSLRREADHLGWSGWFSRIVGATDTTRDKPAPDPVIHAMEPAGFPAGPDVWFVGDTAADLQCAHATGCVPVLIRDEAPTPGEFPGHEPRYHVRDCLALGALMK